MFTIDQEKIVVAPHPDSEQVPAEVQVGLPSDDGQLNLPFVTGYTVDDEGFTNNYAIEPNMYFAENLSFEQQRRSIVQWGIASVFFALASLIALSVSGKF